MNIIESNKLIAEFMNNKHSHYSHNVQDGIMYYHSSWEWLMPVVKKIQKLPLLQFGNKKQVMNALMDVEIETLWASVVHFIEWYNKNAELSIRPAEK